MSVNLAPTFGAGYQAFGSTNIPLSGGFIYTYAAGTTTPQATYTSSSGSVANSNPIVLNADGRPPSEIWLTGGLTYKFVLYDSLSNLIATYDNLIGINDIATGSSEWIGASTPTYISTTSFSVVGTQTLNFTPNRRMYSVNTGGTIYSTVLTSVAAGGITTVTVVNDSGVLDSGLSAVNYAILNSTHPSMPPYSDVQFMVQDSVDPTKRAQFTTSSLATSTTAVITITGSGTIPQSINGALLNTIYFTAQTIAITMTSPAAPVVLTVSAAPILPANFSPIRLTTTGTLPSPLATGTSYYVSNASSTTFNITGSIGGALINTTTTGSGVVTLNSIYPKNVSSSYIVTEVWGGGGGGGGCSAISNATAGGGAGGYSRQKILVASIGATETVTVGAGGTGGTTVPSAGGTGGTSSFGSHSSATGGAGGAAGTASNLSTAGGAGGAGANGDINLTGNPGFNSTFYSTNAAQFAGSGGSTSLGGAALGGLGASGAGVNAVNNSGSGGSGSGNTSNAAGGVGGSGCVIVYEYS